MWWALCAVLTSPCPELAVHETPLDCPWVGLARRLTAEANAGRDPGVLFDRAAPQLAAALRADAKRQGLLSLWSQSLNHDERTDVPWVDPRILAVLSRRMALPVSDYPTVHAGLLHTYGTLFSGLVSEEEGVRRRRWLSGATERGLGIATGLLGPLPKEGSLFANATYVLARIALWDSASAQAVLARTHVPRPLRTIPYATFATRRLEERVRVPQVSGREFVLRTDAVRLPHPQPEATHLIVYSSFDPSEDRAALIAGLPASATLVEQIFTEEGTGEECVVSTRFDAYIEGLTGSAQPLPGTRRIFSLHEAPR